MGSGEDRDYEDWLLQRRWKGYMDHPTYAPAGVKKAPGLKIPKKGTPLSEVPDVLKGLVSDGS